MNDRTSPAEYVDVEGGRIADQVVGDGPLVGSPLGWLTRSTYRFLAPLIADAAPPCCQCRPPWTW